MLTLFLLSWRLKSEAILQFGRMIFPSRAKEYHHCGRKSCLQGIMDLPAGLVDSVCNLPDKGDEIQKPSTCRATLFHYKFWLMSHIFHLA